MGKIKDKLIAAEDAAKAVFGKLETEVKADLTYVNSTLLNFPTDIHNLTSELKQTMIRLATRINGQEDKFKLYLQTLEVCMKHVEAKFVEKKQHIETVIANEKAKADAVETTFINAAEEVKKDVK